MAEVAPGAREERLRRRAVHVDVLVVRKDELREAQRVLRPGLLPQMKACPPAPRRGSRPSPAAPPRRRRRWRRSRVLALEVGRIAARVRDDLLLRDARRAGSSRAGRRRTPSARRRSGSCCRSTCRPRRSCAAARRRSPGRWPRAGTGHVHEDVRAVGQRGSQRMPLHGQLDLAHRAARVTFMALVVPAPITPSASRMWRAWKRFTASTTAAS